MVRKIKKTYKTRTPELKQKIQADFLEFWHQGYSTDLIFERLEKIHFLGPSRIKQLVEARKITKGLKRTL